MSTSDSVRYHYQNIMSTSPDKKKSSPSGKVTIVFLKCDKVPEEAIEAHGEYQDVLHNLFEPLMPKDRNLELETLSYDVVHKREYPKEDVLARADAVVVSGSFEDEAHSDTMWILKLAGFLIKLHVSHTLTRGGKKCSPETFFRTSIPRPESSASVSACKLSLELSGPLPSGKIQKDGK